MGIEIKLEGSLVKESTLIVTWWNDLLIVTATVWNAIVTHKKPDPEDIKEIKTRQKN